MTRWHAAPRDDRVNDLRHLAFVIDGLATVSDRAAVVRTSLEKARTIVEAAFSSYPDLAAVSFFSPETQAWLNDRRDGGTVAEACAQGLRGLGASALAQDASLRILGRIEDLPEGIRAQSAPQGDRPRQVVWFLDYSGRDEILRAATRFLQEHPGVPLREEDLAGRLDTAGLPDPDFVLFAGGELEPKDFMLWQTSYAEIWHGSKSWLEFTTEDLRVAVDDYAHRHRRFGK